MAQTHTKHRDRKRISEAREQRDIEIYQAHMRGNSVRAIQELFGIKSTQTVHAATTRGRELVKERGIDIEERRIEIDQLFRNTLGALAAEVQRQAVEGRVTTIQRSDGSSEVKTVRGIESRTAEALARSADRWGQFLGLTDRAAETNQVVFNAHNFNQLMGLPEQGEQAAALDVTATQAVTHQEQIPDGDRANRRLPVEAMPEAMPNGPEMASEGPEGVGQG